MAKHSPRPKMKQKSERLTKIIRMLEAKKIITSLKKKLVIMRMQMRILVFPKLGITK